MQLHLLFSHLLGAWLLLSFFPEELRAQMIDDRPIKVCGRDFVRALIDICGRSRPKRISMMQRPLLGEPEHMFVSHGNDGEGGKFDSEDIPGWKEEGIPQLKNMLSVLAHTEDSTPTAKEIKAINPLEQSDSNNLEHPRKREAWSVH